MKDEPAGLPLSTGGRILVVDDLAPARQATARVLRRAGYEVSEAEDGATALQLLHAHQPHLVLLDMGLPDLPGTEVLRRIKADPLLGTVMVVMLSAQYRDSAGQAAALDAGADGYLLRPLPHAELLARVRAQMRQGLMTAQQLRASEARYRQIVETAQEGICVIGIDGCVQFANPRLAQLLGLAPEVLPGQPFAGLWDGALSDVLAIDLLPLAASGPCTVQGQLRGSAGRRLPVQLTASTLRADDGSEVGVLALITDLSQRVQAEAELHLLHSAVEQLSEVVLITEAEPLDEPGPRIVFVNDEFERQTGYSRAQALGRSPRFLQGPATQRSELDRLRDALQRQVPVHAELQNRRQDGSEHWIELEMAPVFDAGGRCTHFVSVQRDITRRRQADEAVRARHLAEHASQAKNAFIARVSHELRTPLNAILGFSELMQREARGTPGRMSPAHVDHIQAAGQHLLALINDLLDVSRIEAGQLQLAPGRVELAAAAGSVVSELQLLADQRGIALRLQPEPGPPVAVRADRTRLHQVLLNLVANAIKYNRPGGEVRVEIASDGLRGLARVHDTGPGLSAAQRSHLFEPFNRLGQEDGPVQGTGIGLVICRQLLDAMGGHLQVDSEAGRGSCFSLALPLDGLAADTPDTPGTPTPLAPAAAASAEDSADPPTAAAPPRVVLYVDDDAVNRELMAAMLALLPQTVLHTAADGAGALALAETCRPDLLLLDMMLPDTTGVQLMQALRARPGLAGVPCVAVTANAMPEDVNRALAAGFDAYITKPLQIATLHGTLERLARGRRAG